MSLRMSPRMSLRNKLAIIGLSGLMFTGAAVGLTGMASAQDSGSNLDRPAEDGSTAEPEPADVAEGEGVGFLDESGLSAYDEAVFDRFDQCLADNGVDVEAIEGDIEALEAEELTEEELDQRWEAIEAVVEQAFESCDPILEDLSEDVFGFHDFDDFDFNDFDFDDFDFEDFDPEDFEQLEAFDLSAEDEAVFERFDQCLVDNGIEAAEDSAMTLEDSEGELTDEQWDAVDGEFDRIFETCDPILDDLSDDAELLFEDCPDEHEDAIGTEEADEGSVDMTKLEHSSVEA